MVYISSKSNKYQLSSIVVVLQQPFIFLLNQINTLSKKHGHANLPLFIFLLNQINTEKAPISAATIVKFTFLLNQINTTT